MPDALPEGDHGLQWRPLCRAELDQLSGLLTAIEHLDEPVERHSVSELYERFDAIDSDPESDTIVGRDGAGFPVAYGWARRVQFDVDPRRVYLSGGVHPGWRRRGIGTALLRWQLDGARRAYLDSLSEEHGPLRIICLVEDRLSEQRAVYASVGLTPNRWFADLTRRLSDPAPELVVPEGIRIAPMREDQLEAVRLAHNEASTGLWGAQPIDEAHWREELSRSTCRLEWSWVAIDNATSEIVGYITNSAYEQDWPAQGFSDGWTDRLGVRPAWRRRGIARALLTASMRSYAYAGLDAAGLGVDTEQPTGAYGLYAAMGFVATNTTVLYACTETPEEAKAALDEPNEKSTSH